MSPEESAAIERRRMDKVTTWERHGQSILASLVLAGIISVSINQNTTSNRLTEIDGKLELMNYKFNSLQEQVALSQRTNFSRVEANARITTFKEKHKEFEKRLTALERKTK